MLTPIQLSTLKSLASADQAAANFIETADDQALADWFNAIDASFFVYRSVLTPAMARAAIIQGATQLDGLTVGKRDSLFYLASGDLAVFKSEVRAALDDLCGTMNQLKLYIQGACKRNATRAEKSLVESGIGSNAVPAVMGYEGKLSAADASQVRVA